MNGWSSSASSYHADVRRILVPELRRLRDRSQWMECERWARTVLEFDPYNEDATLILANSLAMTGSPRSATTLIETYRARDRPGRDRGGAAAGA